MIELFQYKLSKFRMVGFLPFLMFVLILLAASTKVQGQFIQFSMTVDTEVGATVESALDFGFLNPNEPSVINLGDASMGIFSITGIPSQYISVELILDEYLIHAENPGCKLDVCRIRVELRAAYANQGQSVGDTRGVVPIVNNLAFFPILQTSGRPSRSLHTSYLYLYGKLDINDVMPGTYTGIAKVVVEFQ